MPIILLKNEKYPYIWPLDIGSGVFIKTETPSYINSTIENRQGGQLIDRLAHF